MDTKTQIFIDRATAIHGDKYDYSLVVYEKSSIKVIIICPTHGEFAQAPDSHLNRKMGCRLCGIINKKRTNLERYGHENIAHGTKKEKIKQTNLERYGHENIAHGTKKEKVKATNLQRYGSEYSLGSPIIRDKIKATNLEKYGVTSYTQTPQYVAAHTAINLDRYGCDNHSQRHMLDILFLLQDPIWLIDQYITQDKTATQIADELGVTSKTVCGYLRRADITIKASYSTSYTANQWLDSLGITNREYQWHTENKRLKSDGYDPDTNTIYEFHGDYWHGNPNIFAAEIYNESTDCIMGELYRRTKLREEEILNLGYNLVVMWESDWLKHLNA
jgi:G:T-mismatch repair DNA endonuclease (very short patch repair protein)